MKKKRGEKDKEGANGEKPSRKRKGGAVLEAPAQAALDQTATIEEVPEE